MNGMKILSIAALIAMGAAAAQAQEITLRAGHSANVDEPYHKGLERFAQIVSEKTEGRVKVEIFANNQLGDEKEMIEGLMLGTLDITVPSNGVLTNFAPALSIFDLPFLFDDREHMYRVMDGEVGQALAGEMKAAGFQLLGFYEAGIRHIVTKEPIESVEDIQGDKIRTMGVPAHVASFNAFGANATPLPYSELYSALEAGVVDGAEAAYTNYYSKRFYEVAPNLAEVAWTALVADLIMSEERFASLPADVQAVLLEAGAESARYQREVYTASDEELKKLIEAKGVKITHPDIAPFRERAKAVYGEFAETDTKRELLEMIETAR